MTSFSDTFDQFLEAAFALDPLFATATGNHDHDGRWADLSEAGRARRLRFAADWSATFAAFGDDVLTVEERVDRDLLLGELEVQRFGDEVLREEAWSPLWWVYVVGGGLFTCSPASSRRSRSGSARWPTVPTACLPSSTPRARGPRRPAGPARRPAPRGEGDRAVAGPDLDRRRGDRDRRGGGGRRR